MQHCSFCDTTMTVQAVDGESKGCEKGVPTVLLLPYRGYLYYCGAPICQEEMASKVKAWGKWRMAVQLAYDKLCKNRCGFCFKLSEDVHR